MDPKRKQPKLEDKTDRFVLDKGFLALGFDQAAAAILRFREMKVKGSFNFRGTPFAEAEIERAQKLAETLHLTDAEERALAGAVPALLSYLNILHHASGLEDIAFKIIARPSLWSILRHGGVTAGIWFKPEQIGAGPANEVGFPASPRYSFPLAMELNKQPALNLSLMVMSPQPPLLVCGGVAGLLAEKPGDRETYLTLRVISARRGAFKP